MYFSYPLRLKKVYFRRSSTLKILTTINVNTHYPKLYLKINKEIKL